MAGRLVAILVHAQDDRDVLVLGRRADDDLLGTGIDVRPGLLGVREDAGRFEDDLDAEVAPRQGRGILLGEDLDLAAIDDDRAVARLDLTVVGAVGRVVLEEQGVHLGIDEVVDRDDFDVRARARSAP